MNSVWSVSCSATTFASRLGGARKCEGWRLYGLLAAVLSLVGLQAAAAAPLVSSPQYAFLIETSGAAAGHKTQIAEAVAARILSGLDGQMRAGEVFSIWAVDEQGATKRMMPVIWTPQTREVMAQHFRRVLLDSFFDGPARFDGALREILKSTVTSDSVQIIILHLRADRFGTEFDQKIHAASLVALQGSGSGGLLATTLLARNNRVIGWSVEAAAPSLTAAAGPAENSKSVPALAHSLSPNSRAELIRPAGEGISRTVNSLERTAPVMFRELSRPDGTALSGGRPTQPPSIRSGTSKPAESRSLEPNPATEQGEDEGPLSHGSGLWSWEGTVLPESRTGEQPSGDRPSNEALASALEMTPRTEIAAVEANGAARGLSSPEPRVATAAAGAGSQAAPSTAPAVRSEEHSGQSGRLAGVTSGTVTARALEPGEDAVTHPSIRPGTYLVAGIILLLLAVITLAYFGRAASRGEGQTSYISQSFHHK